MKRRQAIECVLLSSLGLATGIACGKKKEPLPVMESLGPFSLTDQNNKAFSQNDLEGKVWLASFMFTRCPSTCPRMMVYLKAVQDEAKKRGIALHLVTFSVDPENDTPEVLRAFAEKYEVDLGSWSFLTGDYSSIKETCVSGFKMALEGKADAKKEDFGILHGSHLVLVDQKMNLRGYYPTKEDATRERLLKDAAGLSTEG